MMQVTINIVGASNVPAADLLTGKSDPFCVVSLRSNSSATQKTDTAHNTLHPTWHASTFTFNVNNPNNDFFDVVMYDYDLAKNAEELARLQIPASRLFNQPVIDEWMPMQITAKVSKLQVIVSKHDNSAPCNLHVILRNNSGGNGGNQNGYGPPQMNNNYGQPNQGYPQGTGAGYGNPYGGGGYPPQQGGNYGGYPQGGGGNYGGNGYGGPNQGGYPQQGGNYGGMQQGGYPQGGGYGGQGPNQGGNYGGYPQGGGGGGYQNSNQQGQQGGGSTAGKILGIASHLLHKDSQY